MDNLSIKLYKTPKTILTNKDLALIWGENNLNNLKAKTAYYVKKKILIHLSRGVFAKDRNYNIKELAANIYKPSYISFETVLREAGLIFQYYEKIFIASRLSKIVTIDKHNFKFRKLKDEIIFNPAGVIVKNNYSLASPERAFLDMLYLFPNYYFDNLSFLDWKKCKRLVELYHNQKLLERLKIYHKNYA